MMKTCTTFAVSTLAPVSASTQLGLWGVVERSTFLGCLIDFTFVTLQFHACCVMILKLTVIIEYPDSDF